jgi:hypothetical protein
VAEGVRILDPYVNPQFLHFNGSQQVSHADLDGVWEREHWGVVFVVSCDEGFTEGDI